MSNAAHTNAASLPNRDAARRVLVIARTQAGESLAAEIGRAGYEARAVRAERAPQALDEFAPHVAMVEAGAEGSAGLEFANRLRGARETDALALVLLFDGAAADAGLRAAALRIGADDLFALTTPPAQICARLDALFWRIEAGRRTVSLSALERRAEIDDFLQLLDTVRVAIDASSTGALALISAAATVETGASAARDERTLAAAYEFFKLNLRRADAIAFYGPTLLLAYLPRRARAAASAEFARLCDEFQTQGPVRAPALSVGLASFPTDGTEIESLIEQAESALGQARPLHAEQESEEGVSPAATTAKSPADAALASFASQGSHAPSATEQPTAEQHLRMSDFSTQRAVRESKGADTDASMMQAGGAGASAIGQGTLGQSASDAAARERERRTRGAVMPRRLLLTVSDPARMAQINLLLRSAGYEVRAAFDGLQAINLLRIERPDLLVIDDALYGIDGLEALRRLQRQHHGRLPLPVVLLLSQDGAERERVREEARSLGARGFVTVPYDPDELLTCVRTVGSTD